MEREIKIFVLAMLMIISSFVIPQVTVEAAEIGPGLNLLVHTQTSLYSSSLNNSSTIRMLHVNDRLAIRGSSATVNNRFSVRHASSNSNGWVRTAHVSWIASHGMPLHYLPYE